MEPTDDMLIEIGRRALDGCKDDLDCPFCDADEPADGNTHDKDCEIGTALLLESGEPDMRTP